MRHAKIIAASLATVMSIMLVPAVSQAAPLPVDQQIVSQVSMSTDPSVASAKLSSEDKQFIAKIARAGSEFIFRDGKIATKASEQKFETRWGFSKQEYSRLLTTVIGHPVEGEATATSNPLPTINLVWVGGYAVHFTNADLKVGIASTLFAAAQIGPEALAAAWVAFSSAVGGPIGTVAGAITAVAGSTFFINVAACMVNAVATGRGVAIGTQLQIPPVYVTVE